MKNKTIIHGGSSSVEILQSLSFYNHKNTYL